MVSLLGKVIEEKEMKKSILHISADAIRVILIVLGSVISTFILSFAIMAIIKVESGDLDGASSYLLTIFIALGFSRLILFFRERTKTNLIRFIVLFVFDVCLGLLVFFGKDHADFYKACAGLFCLSVVTSRVFRVISNHSIRSIIFNIIVIILAVFIALGVLFPEEEDTVFPVLIVSLIVAISALLEVMGGAFSQLKFKTLFKIVIKTYALEVLLGLLTMIVASSLIFMYFEPNINTFYDGLWYSFAVVTTIGFGDFAAQTLIGRVVTVLLGIYGIIVVAVITSIIVNFYNETSGKHDAQEFKEIKKEIDNKKK